MTSHRSPRVMTGSMTSTLRDGGPSSDALFPPKKKVASLRPAYESSTFGQSQWAMIWSAKFFFSYNGAPVCSVSQFPKWHRNNDEEDIQVLDVLSAVRRRLVPCSDTVDGIFSPCCSSIYRKTVRFERSFRFLASCPLCAVLGCQWHFFLICARKISQPQISLHVL